LGTRHRTKSNQVWTIQRRRQHWQQDTERRAIKYGQSRDVDNIGNKTQNEGAIKCGQSRDVDNIGNKTQNEGAIKYGQSRDVDNIESKTQNEEKQSNKYNTEN
jgi:hypothetical protein